MDGPEGDYPLSISNGSIIATIAITITFIVPSTNKI